VEAAVNFVAAEETAATPWWQIKLCGEAGDGKPVSPFSNIISFGPVP
jgi:hypothetical protein